MSESTLPPPDAALPPELGTHLATGRSAEVHAWGTDRVVKVFHPGYPAAEIDREEAYSAEAHRLGLTAVRCHGQVRVGEQTGLVLDRVVGESLTRVMERNPLRLPRSAGVLARLQTRLHAQDSEVFPDLRESVIALLDTPPLAFLTDTERAAAVRRIRALPEGSNVLHMDFHPENVFTAGDAGHEVIDWPTARRGDPAADVAATVFLLRDAELWPGTPALKKLVFNVFRRTLCTSWLAQYLRLTGMDRAEIDRWRLPVLVMRLGELDIASEREKLRREIRAQLPEGAR